MRRRRFSFTAPLIAVDGKVYARPAVRRLDDDRPGRLRRPRPGHPDGREDPASRHSSTDTVRTPRTPDPNCSGSTLFYTKIEGTLPGRSVHALFSSAALAPFEVTFRSRPTTSCYQRPSMTGPFYGDNGDSTYSITLDLSADPVTIEAPE